MLPKTSLGKVDVLTLKTLCSFDNKEVRETMIPNNTEYRLFEYDCEGKLIRKYDTCKNDIVSQI